MNVGEYQFSATLLMALLTLSLAFVLPRKVGLGGDVNRSRSELPEMWMTAFS